MNVSVLQGLQVHEANVRFGDLHVLGPVSFDVRLGECVVLLGPSGCGKSTLLAAIAGLQRLTEGEIENGGEANIPGFVFQEANLLPWLSVVDNIALPLTLGQVAGQDARARARQALDQVGLSEFAQAKPRALSGGMAMRVALARALVNQPKVLLLDEPFGAIDEIGRRGLNDLVHATKNQNNLAVLFVTHSIEEAVYMADRILVLSARPGTIVEEITVSIGKRDRAFLVSDEFADLALRARRALAHGHAL